MKKFLVIVVMVLMTDSAFSQNVKISGDLAMCQKSLNLKIVFDTAYKAPNGGELLHIIYAKGALDDSLAYLDKILDTLKPYHFDLRHASSASSTEVIGAQIIECHEDYLVITRNYEKSVPLISTVFTFYKWGAVREDHFTNGKLRKRQILPTW